MTINPLDILRKPLPSTPAASAVDAASNQDLASSFGSLLDAAKTKFDKTQKAEKAAGDLVSNALILPMLKQLRRSPWKENSVFSGGIGEKAFGPEFDMQIADRIAHSPRLGIKAALANRLVNHNDGHNVKTTNFGKLDIHG